MLVNLFPINTSMSQSLNRQQTHSTSMHLYATVRAILSYQNTITVYYGNGNVFCDGKLIVMNDKVTGFVW